MNRQIIYDCYNYLSYHPMQLRSLLTRNHSIIIMLWVVHTWKIYSASNATFLTQFYKILLIYHKSNGSLIDSGASCIRK